MHSSFYLRVYCGLFVHNRVFSLLWLLAACKTDFKIHDCTAVTKQIRWSKKQIILTFYCFFFLVVKSHNNSTAHCVPVRLFYVPPTLPQKNKSYYRYVITSKILNEIHALEKKTRISCFEKLIYFFSYQELIINSTWKFTLLSMFVSDHLSWTNALYH